MRTLVALLLLLAAIPARGWAAPDGDPVLQAGLTALETQTNGLQAACLIWFPDSPQRAADAEAKVYALSKELGTVIGSEIVGSQRLSARDERWYVALYYERRPLWLMFERYVGSVGGKDTPVFLPVRVSASADDILPSYLTEFKTAHAP